jgi:photosystem II stability/assembly factor-like uncharacterized protein
MNVCKIMIGFGFAGLLVLNFSCREALQPQWELPAFPSDSRLNVIHFTDPQTAFVGGGIRFEETLLQKSVDGGNAWLGRFPEPAFDEMLFDVKFRDKQRGFAVGMGGKVLRTVDGGENWATRQMKTWSPLHAIVVVDDSLLVTVGGNGYGSGVILRSTTFGATWEGWDTLAFELRDVYFTSSQVGYACGYGVVLKTTDGGENWDFLEVEGDFFSGIHFPTSKVGYVVGRAGSIFKTTDAGTSWQRLRNGNFLLNAPDAYHAVHFLDEMTGYIVGDKGLIIKTVDGGAKWQRIEPYSKADLHDLFVFGEGDLVVVGKEGTILRLRE